MLRKLLLGDRSLLASDQESTVSPEDLGLSRGKVQDLVVESPEQSLAVMMSVLNGEAGTTRDIVMLNAGAAIYVAGAAPDFAAGLAMAA